MAIAAVVAAVTTGVATPAAADQVSLTLKYHCVFPMVGPQPLSVKISGGIPKSVKPGVPTEKFVIDTVSTVTAAATRALVQGLRTRTLEGKALAKVSIDSPDASLPLGVTVTLDKMTVPDSGDFPVHAVGTTPALTFVTPGTAKIYVGDLLLTLAPKAADGLQTGLGPSFESECTQDPGQTNLLAEMVIEGGAVHQDFKVKGSSLIKAANGIAPLTGSLGADLDAGTGTVSGDLALDPTKVGFMVLGFLPVVADLAFVPVGKTTGTLTAGKLTTNSKLTVRMPSFSLFGLPVGGGANCQTAQPADLRLKSTEASFDPAKGGPLATNDFTLSAIKDCGMITGALSNHLAGSGNTVDLVLTPRG